MEATDTITPEQAFIAHLSHDAPATGCEHCEVRPMIGDLHDAIHGKATLPRLTHAEAFDLIWSMQDGYGVPGYTPDQGFDWSGVRDSTPATIKAMWYAVFGTGD